MTWVQALGPEGLPVSGPVADFPFDPRGEPRPSLASAGPPAHTEPLVSVAVWIPDRL